MTSSAAIARRRGSGASALMLAGAVAVLALPSAVLALTSGLEAQEVAAEADAATPGFVASEVDPRLARSITVRALSKGRTFRFTPAATPSGIDNGVITVAVRLPARAGRLASAGGAPAAETIMAASALRIAPTAYSLGAARGYRSFAQDKSGAPEIRRIEMPDLASYRPRGTVGPGDSARFAPRVVLDERETTGRSPRTFEQNDQTVDLGGSYRLTRNINVTAGVRYQSERDRLDPLTDGSQDSQAVYVGTQLRF